MRCCILSLVFTDSAIRPLEWEQSTWRRKQLRSIDYLQYASCTICILNLERSFIEGIHGYTTSGKL